MTENHEYTLDVLAAVIDQACWMKEPYRDTTHDSGFITVYAAAMRELAKYGKFVIDVDAGGRDVCGHFPPGVLDLV